LPEYVHYYGRLNVCDDTIRGAGASTRVAIGIGGTCKFPFLAR